MAKTDLEQQAFQKRVRRVEGLIQDMQKLPDPSARAMAKDLAQSLMDLHGTGLERMLDLIYESGPGGQAMIDSLGQDGLVGSLLLVHGLHPFPLDMRVARALEKVRPYLGSHGGNVELLGVTPDGVVRLRLEGSCHGCPSSRVTLKYAIEDGIYAAAPDVTSIEVEGAIEAPPSPLAGFIPLGQLLDLPPAPAHAEGWVEAQGASSVTEGTLRLLQIGGMPVLFCRVDRSLYAYGGSCPACAEPLANARLAGKDLVCGVCGHSYDVMRAGRDLDDPRLHLSPLPLLEERGQVRLALPAMAL